MDAETYRRLQLEAVTGHGGTSEQEIIKVTGWLVVAVMAWRLLNLKPGRVSTFLIEFGLLILPQIILFCYPQWARWMIASVAVPGLLLATTSGRFEESDNFVSSVNPSRHVSSPAGPPHAAFLTNTRAAIMIMCVIGILAVDFPSVFPRRFAKTETVGISLMDMGVGCVVVSLGLTAARRHLGSPMMSGRDTKRSNPTSSLWMTMRSTMPLLILGVARMLAVKALDYQEHVSEYGLHWNFFMTLGCLPMLIWLFLGLGRMPAQWSFTMGCLLGLAYEMLLRNTGLASWASLDFNDAVLRASKLPLWLVANKEGLVSLIGYVSLYLMSLGVGSDLMTEMGSLGRANWSVVRRVTGRVIILVISYLVCTRGLDLQPSRRLMNFPFILGSLTLTMIQMMGFLFIDLLPLVRAKSSDTDQTPMIVSSINFNQLALFLLANLLTGIINLTSYTLLQPVSISLAIISTYMFILCCVAAYWHLSHLRWRL